MSVNTYNSTTGVLTRVAGNGGGSFIYPHIYITAETGSTVTITDGTATITAIETSEGLFEADVVNLNTYIITASLDGEEISQTLDVDAVKKYTVNMGGFLPDGSTVLPTDDIQIWLRCAEITDKSYTTLAEVLADTDTYQLLLANSNACDYMARSITWANPNLIPKMTSNTTPEGVADADSEYSSTFQAWKAFDGTNIGGSTSASTDCWASTGPNTFPKYLQYKFETSKVVRKIKVTTRNSDTATDINSPKDVTFKAYNGSSYDTLGTYTNNTATTSNTTFEFTVNNNTPYEYYKLEIGSINKTTAGTSNTDYYCCIGQMKYYEYADASIVDDETAMQLLGKYDYACDKLLSVSTWKNAISNSNYFDYVLDIKIPTMTGYTTPSGTVYTNSEFRSPYLAWKTFNGVLGTTNDENRWVSEQGKYGTNAYLSYDFGESVCITKAQIYAVLSGSSENPIAATLYIEGSNDNDSWTSIISKAMTTTEMSQYIDIDFDYASYRYYRAYFSQCNIRGTGSDYYSQIRVLQLYGRHESSYISGKVAIHGACNSGIYYKDGGSDVSVGTTDINTGIALVNISDMPTGTYAIYDGVAKDPSNLSNDYSKTVSITSNTTDVYLMPDTVWYWYGYKLADVVLNTNRLGGTQSTSTVGTATYNTNSLRISSSSNYSCAFFETPNYVPSANGNVKFITKSSDANQMLYLTSSDVNNFPVVSTVSAPTTKQVSTLSFTSSETRIIPVIRAYQGNYTDIDAIWLDE